MPTPEDYEAMKIDGEALLDIAGKSELERSDMDTIEEIGSRMVGFSTAMLEAEGSDESQDSEDAPLSDNEKDGIIAVLEKKVE